MQGRKGIPYARERIRLAMIVLEAEAPDVSKALEILGDALFHTWRNKEKVGRSKRVSEKMDAEKVMAIKLLITANPSASNKEIADRVHVQAGRVTEVKQGRYDHLVRPEYRVPISPGADTFFQMPLAARAP